MSLIYCLAKFAKKREYLESLRKGTVYMNPLKYFINNCEGELDQRHDKLEALMGYFQQDRYKAFLKKDGKEIEMGGLVAPIVVQSNKFLESHLFCMHAIHSGKWESIPPDSVSLFKDSLKIDTSNSAMGEYALFFTNTLQFQDRVVNALKVNNLEAKWGLVKYVDENSLGGLFNTSEIGFVKMSKYSRQREYRLVVFGAKPVDKPYILDVGNLSDISEITTIDDFNSGLNVEFK